MVSTVNSSKALPFYQYFYPFEKNKLTLEYRLKQYYLAHPDENLNIFRTFSDEDGVFQSLLKDEENFENISYKNIEETFTIEEGFDISITRHIRYLPAYAHTHQFFEIACVLEGSCINYIGDQELQMNVGDFCIIAPGTVHAISAFSDDCILLNCLIRSTTFDSTFFDVISDQPVLSDFFSRTLYKSNDNFYLVFHTGNDEELRQILYSIYHEYNSRKKYCRKLMNYYLSIFFTLLIRNHERDVFIPNPAHNAPEHNFIYMLHYLQNNYQTISLKEFAAFFNYSERQMSRILHDYTGLGFTENVQKYRMNKAVKLLSNPSLSVSDIAEQCGYSNISHFRRTFQKYYQMTPAEYRKVSYKK